LSCVGAPSANGLSEPVLLAAKSFTRFESHLNEYERMQSMIAIAQTCNVARRLGRAPRSYLFAWISCQMP
jgi:hypothetical protein